MKTHEFQRSFLSFVVLILMVSALAIVGCDDDDDDGGQDFNITLTAANGGMLVNEAFQFDDGRIFDDRLDGDSIEVSFLTTNAPEAVGFTLTGDNGDAGGNVTFGSCTFGYILSTFRANDGPQGGESRSFDFCSLLIEDCNVDVGESNTCDGSLVVGDTDGALERSNSQDVDVRINDAGDVFVNGVNIGNVGLRDATAADLENQAFGFENVSIEINDNLVAQAFTLTVGDFDADGDDDPNTAVFSLTGTADGVDFTAGGTFTVGASCLADITFSAIAGEAPEAEVGDPEVLDPCQIDEADGSLRFVDDQSQEFISDPPTSVGIVLDFTGDNAIALSPDNEVDPVEPLDDRPETGTASLRLLSGNILEYTVTVNDLLEEDTLTNSHIHTGGATVNGDVVITLINQPVQFGRTTDIQFPEPTNGAASVTASIVLSSDEAADLANAANPFYVNVHSEQVPAGLVRGQLRDEAPEVPTANAGPDQTITLAADQTTVEVTLDGSGSSAPEGRTIDIYTWTGTPDPAPEVMPTVTLEAGVHTFTLVVTDNTGADSAPDEVTITVEAAGGINGQALYNAGGCPDCHGDNGAGPPDIQGSSPDDLLNAPDFAVHNPIADWSEEELQAVSDFLSQ